MKRRSFLKSLGILGVTTIGGFHIIGTITKQTPIYAPFKGKIIWETGYIYAPYIPLMKTPGLNESKRFYPKKDYVKYECAI